MAKRWQKKKSSKNQKKSNKSSLNDDAQAVVVEKDPQKPFCWKEEMFDKGAATAQIKIRGSGGASTLLTATLVMLVGTESPELFLKWVVQFEEKIQQNQHIPMDEWPDLLRQVSKDESLRLIGESLEYSVDKPADDRHFKDPELEDKIYGMIPHVYQTYLTTREYYEDVVRDVVYHLGERYFGTDKVSQNAYFSLRRLMLNQKIGSQPIRAYANRLLQLDKYQIHCPRKILTRMGLKPKRLTDYEKLTILNMAVDHAQRRELQSRDFDYWNSSFDDVIHELEAKKPSIDLQKQLAEGIKKMRELHGKQMTFTEDDKSKGEGWFCSKCKKKHPNGTKCPKKTQKSTGASNEKIFSMLEDVKETFDSKKSRHVIEEDTGWREGLDPGLQVFVLHEHKEAGGNSDNESIDSGLIGESKRRYKHLEKAIAKGKRKRS